MIDGMQALPWRSEKKSAPRKYWVVGQLTVQMRYELFPVLREIFANAPIVAGHTRLCRRICSRPARKIGTAPDTLGYHWRFPVND
ncbi:hypothetical protein [Pseudomonas palleroniana]|uniref:hypothetical protein n=1 Tax=Pseudomonas palleroniana TaxID=191390 RepID=UPI0018E6AE91|nr:hypothetical protein [Pseudomonas palleroniana]MBI6911155.1 hypothetical protein [Pseudomonas palleroniana]